MSDPLATIAAILLGFVTVVISTAFFSILRSGPGEIGYMRRKGFGLTSWLAGSLPNSGEGASAGDIEGIEMKARDGRLEWVRRTRTPTSEII